MQLVICPDEIDSTGLSVCVRGRVHVKKTVLRFFSLRFYNTRVKKKIFYGISLLTYRSIKYICFAFYN